MLNSIIYNFKYKNINKLEYRLKHKRELPNR